jgi:predicted PurR-regulated permease PerM
VPGVKAAQRQTSRIIFLCLAGLAAVYLFYLVRSLLIPFAIAAFMAYAIYPLVRLLETRGVNRANAILTVYAAGIILAGIFLLLFIPALFNETKAFESILPVYGNAWTELHIYLNRLSDRVLLPPEVRQILTDMSDRIRSGLYVRMHAFAEDMLYLIAQLPSFLLAPFLAYYILKDYEHFRQRFLDILPPEARSYLVHFLSEADLIFSKFLRGHVLISAIVGFFTGLAAALIGLRFFLLIGIITALLDLIPVFGAIIAAIPVVGLALAQSRVQGILMLILFLTVQELEGFILVPRLLGDRMGLNPLIMMLVLLIGGYFFGALGMIFAVPVTCLMRVVFRSLWDKII